MTLHEDVWWRSGIWLNVVVLVCYVQSKRIISWYFQEKSTKIKCKMMQVDFVPFHIVWCFCFVVIFFFSPNCNWSSLTIPNHSTLLNCSSEMDNKHISMLNYISSGFKTHDFNKNSSFLLIGCRIVHTHLNIEFCCLLSFLYDEKRVFLDSSYIINIDDTLNSFE